VTSTNPRRIGHLAATRDRHARSEATKQSIFPDLARWNASLRSQ
jgi:hypothetical protein